MEKIITSVLMAVMFLTVISGFGMNMGVEITFEDGTSTFMGDKFYGIVSETEEPEQCIQNWSCGNWSQCGNEAETEIETEIIIRVWDMDGNPIEIPDWVSSSNKIRVCLDLNGCNNDTNKPIEIQECEENTNIFEVNKSDEDEIITTDIVNQTNEIQINQIQGMRTDLLSDASVIKSIQIINDRNIENKTDDTFDYIIEDSEEEVAEQQTTTSLETQEVVSIKEKDFFARIWDLIKNVCVEIWSKKK